MIYTIRNILRKIQELLCVKYKKVSHISYPGWYNFTGIAKDKFGNTAYYENGKFHRTDGPALITFDDIKIWYIHGKLHRENGPAVECINCHKEWVINGKRHRADGPAIEYDNGHKEWWINGKCHREDGPAIEYANGEKRWYYNDKFYGENDEFTTESWIKKWRLEIFK